MIRSILRWLPPFRDLDYEQQEAVNRSLEKGGNLIYGPAGSGKTAITLYRAKTLADLNKNFALFVFTNVLLRFVQAGASELNISANRIHSFYKWVWDRYGAEFGGRHPQGEDKFDAMVDGLISRWSSHKSTMPTYEYVLVDEAQDFKPNVARLLHMITPNLLLAADPAQSLYVETRGLNQLMDRWKPLQEPVVVKHNYRNPRPIAELAALFVDDHTAGPASFLSMVKGRLTGSKPVWHEVSSEAEVAEKLKAIINNVRGDKRVGILCRRRKRLGQLQRALARLGTETQIALRDSTDDYDFNSAIPVLTTIHSAKGLEFDWVVLPDLTGDQWDEQADEPSERRLFFVGLTRAKEKLYLISVAGRACSYLREIQRRGPHLLQTPTSPAASYSSSTSTISDDDSPF